MKFLSSCIAALAVAATTPTTAHADFGLGLIVGGPTGITGAYELDDTWSIDGAVGLNLFDGRNFYIHVEGLYHLPDLLGGGSVGLRPYLGVGGFFTHFGKKDEDRAGIGARVPFGLSLMFTRAPIEIFGELVVGLLLVPGVDLGVGGAGGFRYYF